VLGSKTEISLFSILIIQAILIPVFAQETTGNSIIIETDREEYHTAEKMLISGVVETRKMPVVAIKIFNPNGGIISAHQLDLYADNTFNKTIALDSPFYDAKGTYTITMNYGKLSTETNFEIISGTGQSAEAPIEIPSSPEILAMFTDQEVYGDGDTVTIIGLVSEKVEESVLVGIYDPAGTPAGFYFGDVDSNDEFSVSFLVKAGVNFKTEGTYSISAFYGDSEASTSFEYAKQSAVSVPEIIDNKDNDNKDQPKQDTVKDNPVNPPTNVTPKENNQQPPKKQNNLSVEDIELGIMLNEIKLNCDTSDLTDIISYSEGMGPALIRLCKYADAIYFYDQELRNNPKNVDILLNKGSALAKMRFYDAAIMHYDSALSIQPNNYMALNNKANALANLGNYEYAMNLYNAAIAFSPDSSVILKNLQIAQDRASVLKINNENEIKNDNITREEVLVEQEKNLVQSSNQEPLNFFEQLGNALSSIFNIFD
jgi:tetratricopeptide (TPR) repeat protein